MHWIYLAGDTYKWRALVITVMNIGFRKMRRIFRLAKELLALYKGLPRGVVSVLSEFWYVFEIHLQHFVIQEGKNQCTGKERTTSIRAFHYLCFSILFILHGSSKK